MSGRRGLAVHVLVAGVFETKAYDCIGCCHYLGFVYIASIGVP